MSKQPPIFHIEKDNSKLYSVKLSNLQKNISLLSSLNNIPNAHPRSSCSLFQTNSGVNYSDNSVFGLMDNTYDYSFENGKHNSGDSFLLFPQIDNEHKTQDFSSLFKTDEFKGSKNTLQSYFNADYMINTNRECEDIKEENNNSTNFILKKKRKIIKKGILRKNSKKIYKCEHINCPLSFKTHKQRYNHHKKMCIECHKDTLNMLKGIKQIKEIYNTIIKESSNEMKEKYHTIMTSKSLEGYAQVFVGLTIDDKIQSNMNNNDMII